METRPPNQKEQAILKEDFALADRLKIPVITLNGEVSPEIIRYAKENQITQLIVGHSDRSRIQEFLRGSIINQLTQNLRMTDILIVATE